MPPPSPSSAPSAAVMAAMSPNAAWTRYAPDIAALLNAGSSPRVDSNSGSSSGGSSSSRGAWERVGTTSAHIDEELAAEAAALEAITGKAPELVPLPPMPTQLPSASLRASRLSGVDDARSASGTNSAGSYFNGASSSSTAVDPVAQLEKLSIRELYLLGGGSL